MHAFLLKKKNKRIVVGKYSSNSPPSLYLSRVTVAGLGLGMGVGVTWFIYVGRYVCTGRMRTRMGLLAVGDA